MITLCMDTSHTELALALLKDGAVLASVQEPCWKRQSEEFFPNLEKIMAAAGLVPEDIDQVAVSKGPGSYTGVRIAMTAAKVICSLRKLPLYTILTTDLYSAGEPDCIVLLDARGGRAYAAAYRNGACVMPVEARPLAEILPQIDDDLTVIGDGHLVGREDHMPDIATCFLQAEDRWQRIPNPDLAVPEYLKPSEAYRVK